MEQYNQLDQRVSDLAARRITQSQIINKAVKQRHIEASIIFRGLLADLPDGTTEVQAYFATDNNKLYIYNPVSLAWKSVTLS